MAGRGVIGYYVHHHGQGHRHRMRSIAGHLADLGLPVTVLSSLARQPADPAAWVRLPRDDETSGTPGDPTAHGRLHWAPRHDEGLARRAAAVTAWAARERPRAIVVDVSVEVSLLARLSGIPVVVVAQPGRRDDPAHVLGYDLADAIIAPWPSGHATGWPDSWLAKTTFVGAISRYDGRDRPTPSPPPSDGRRRGLLLWGAGGDGSGDRVVRSLREGTPRWEWELAGPGGRLLDEHETWQALGRAEVVVTHAGQNSVAEVAAARRRAVVVADRRPFDEQVVTARRLRDASLASVAEGCPDPAEWEPLLAGALRLDPDAWSRWSTGRGGLDAARVVTSVADVGGWSP